MASFLPRLFGTGADKEAELLSVQKGILDATQATAKAQAYQSEQMAYQSELLDTMVSAIRSLKNAIVAGVKVGNVPGGAAQPRVVNRSGPAFENDELKKVTDKNGKTMWQDKNGKFASKAAAEQKERDIVIIGIFTGIEAAVSYTNELLTEQTAMMDTLVRSNRSVSAFLKTFIRRVADDKKKADAEASQNELQESEEKTNERNKKKGEDGEGRKRGGKFHAWEAILDGFANILKGLLIPLLIGFGDGLDKSLGWIGKVTDGFKTLCGWIGDAITAFNNWFSGDDKHEGIFNKLLDHIHDVFSAIADFDPREVIKKILEALPASVQKVIPDALLKYAGIGKYAKQEETYDESISRKNREEAVGAKFENKFDQSQQEQWNKIGEKIKAQGKATDEDTAALNKIVGDSRGFLGRTFGSDEEQQRYVKAYETQMSMRGNFARENTKAIAASGVDTDKLWEKLSPEIAKGESGSAGYNAHHGGPIPGLTDMTLEQIAKTVTGAVGKYQFLPKTTLLEAARMAGLKPSDKFSPENQEKMGRALFDMRVKRGAKDGVAGIQKQLSLEWASLPKDLSGAGAYDGDAAGNKASGGATRAASIANDIQASVVQPAPAGNVPTSDTGKQLAEAAQKPAATPVAAPTVVAPQTTNVTNNQTVNQAPLSATTPAEFAPHV